MPAKKPTKKSFEEARQEIIDRMAKVAQPKKIIGEEPPPLMNEEQAEKWEPPQIDESDAAPNLDIDFNTDDLSAIIGVEIPEPSTSSGAHWTYGPDTSEPEYTGGSVSYYQVAISDPTTPGRAPYIAECNDIIEALGMSFAEGNIFKAIWRIANQRQGKSKQGYRDSLYDAEKVVFFGQRMVKQAKR